MSKVSAHNEWDMLEEVIIGRIEGAQIPRAGNDLFAIEFSAHGSVNKVPSGSLPQSVIEETAEDLDQLSEALTGLGITAQRPIRHRPTVGEQVVPCHRPSRSSFSLYSPAHQSFWPLSA